MSNLQGKAKADFLYDMLTKQSRKNHSKSPPVKTLLRDLPTDILDLLKEHFQSLLKYELRDWIKKNSHKLIFANLSSNSKAMDYLTLPDNIEKIDYFQLSSNTNPNTLLLIVNRIKYEKLLQKKSTAEYNTLKNKINWGILSANPIAVNLLETYENDIVWSAFCSNPNPEALRLIEKELEKDADTDKIVWEVLSANPIVIQLFEKYPHYKKYIDYSGLSANSSNEAIKLLNKNPDEIDFGMLSGNTNPKALKLLEKKLEKDPDEIDWVKLAGNTAPEAMNILKINLDKLKLYGSDGSDWEVIPALSSNSSDEAIDLLKELLKKGMNIDWTALSGNANLKALELLKKNQEKIYWENFSENPSIFILK